MIVSSMHFQQFWREYICKLVCVVTKFLMYKIIVVREQRFFRTGKTKFYMPVVNLWGQVIFL